MVIWLIKFVVNRMVTKTKTNNNNKIMVITEKYKQLFWRTPLPLYNNIISYQDTTLWHNLICRQIHMHCTDAILCKNSNLSHCRIQSWYPLSITNLTVINQNILMKGEWLMVHGEWCMVNGVWWMVNDKWWMVNDEWWMVSSEWWMSNGEWWMMNGEWWMVNIELWMVNNEWWMVNGE